MPKGITAAELVDRPAELGGGRLAIVGFKEGAHPRFSRALCAFDVEGDRDHAIWAKRIREEDLPDNLPARGRHAELFSVTRAKAIDVFPDYPGAEIVASYHCMHSQRALRIYSLEGELLYQVWHDGDLGDCYWMSEARQLVLIGDNGVAYWEERGYPDVISPYPRILFAIEPRAGMVTQEYVRYQSTDDGVTPAWYQCVLPPELTDILQPHQLQVPPGRDPGRFVSLAFRSGTDSSAEVAWVIDEFGNKLPDPLFVGDPYQRNQLLPDGDPRKLPDPHDPNLWYFGDLPPRVTGDRPAAGFIAPEDRPEAGPP